MASDNKSDAHERPRGTWDATPDTHEMIDSVDGKEIEKKDPLKNTVYEKINTDYEQRDDWLSHGYTTQDRDEDAFFYHASFFLFWSIGGGMLWVMLGYRPVGWRSMNWQGREAYLELHRRETLGIDLVSPDLIPRHRIILPSEEELVNFPVHI